MISSCVCLKKLKFFMQSFSTCCFLDVLNLTAKIFNWHNQWLDILVADPIYLENTTLERTVLTYTHTCTFDWNIVRFTQVNYAYCFNSIYFNAWDYLIPGSPYKLQYFAVHKCYIARTTFFNYALQK